MLKKTITYKDFTGEETTEDFYFNLTKAEIVELEVSAEGNSLSDWLAKISKNLQGAELIKAFKLIIARSYGVKSVDGRRFEKSPQILSEFESTVAYSDLFMQLATDAEFASEWINGLMPEGMGKGQSVTSKEGLSPSEQARKASEERFQGFQKSQEKPAQTFEKVPELETAAPVLEPQEETREQLEARIRAEYASTVKAE